MIGLRWKITLFLIGTVFAVISITSLIIDQTLDRQFQRYLQRAYESRRTDVANALSRIYDDAGGWEAFLSHPSAPMLLHSAGVARLTDEDGKLIYQGPVARRPRICPPENAKPLTNEDCLVPITIYWYGRTVGKAWILGPPTRQALPARELRFRLTLRRAILLASLFAAILAIVLGLLGAQRLTQPIRELTLIAKRLSTGDLQVRSQLKSKDELGGLAGTLNHLAAELERTDNSRRKALADTAHEFRTPLTTIRGHLEAMSDGVISSTPEAFNVVLEEVDRLVQLTDDLQSFTLVERFYQDPNLVELELNDLLHQVEEGFRPLFQRKGIRFQTVMPNWKVTVTSHGQALRQIIDNLLNNAVKYTPDHEDREVSVILTQEDGQAKIAIQDQGVGIPPQDLPHIFDRFYRVDASRSRLTGGVGLGLAIAKETAEAIGLQIHVESTPSLGTTFTLTFPARSS